MDKFVLGVGWIAISALSLIIARRVRRHLTAQISAIVHLLIAVLALYYLFDLSRWSDLSPSNPYFIFWLLVLITQAALYVKVRGRTIPRKGVANESTDHRGRTRDQTSSTHTHTE